MISNDDYQYKDDCFNAKIIANDDSKDDCFNTKAEKEEILL